MRILILMLLCVSAYAEQMVYLSAITPEPMDLLVTQITDTFWCNEDGTQPPDYTTNPIAGFKIDSIFGGEANGGNCWIHTPLSGREGRPFSYNETYDTTISSTYVNWSVSAANGSWDTSGFAEVVTNNAKYITFGDIDDSSVNYTLNGSLISRPDFTIAPVMNIRGTLDGETIPEPDYTEPTTVYPDVFTNPIVPIVTLSGSSGGVFINGVYAEGDSINGRESWTMNVDTDIDTSIYYDGINKWVIETINNGVTLSSYSIFSQTNSLTIPTTGWMSIFGWSAPTNVVLGTGSVETYNWSNTNMVDRAIDSGAPAISEWTRQANVGDTIALTAEDMGTNTSFVILGGSTNHYIANPRLISDRQAAITLSPSVGATEQDLYLICPRNGTNYGAPIAINQTEAWWVGPDTVATGETFSVYGRNLELGDDGLTQLYIDGHGWVTNSGANPYKVDFVVPALTNGNYDIYAHNGHGGKYGWSDALTLTVESAVDWSAGTTHTVTNGAGDDLSAIESAIIGATAGDTIYFTNGTYTVSGSIDQDFSGLRLLGESTNAVITSGSSMSKIISQSSLSDAVIERLTIDSGTLLTTTQGFITMTYANNVKFIDCYLTLEKHPVHTFSSVDPFVMSHSVLLSFTGCTFDISGPLSNTYGRQFFFEDCNFRAINDCWIVINNGRSSQTSIFDCTLRHYNNSNQDDPHGWGVGRFYHSAGSVGNNIGRTSDVYFGGNRTTDMTSRADYYDQNQGEQYLVDTSATYMRRLATGGESNSVSFSSLVDSDYGPVNTSPVEAGITIAIIGGTGVGQFRDIEDIDTDLNKITVTKNWRVQPDATSLIILDTSAIRHVVYDCDLDGTPDWVTPNPVNPAWDSWYQKAAAGVYLYGGSYGCVIDSNTFNEFRDGVNLAKLQTGSLERGHLFTDIKDNTFSDSGVAMYHEISQYGGTVVYFDETYIGNSWRNNYVTNCLSGIWNRGRYDNARIDLTIALNTHENARTTFAK